MKNIPDDSEQELFWAELDRAGEAQIRTWLKLQRFHGPKLALAERWIEAKDQEREAALEERRHASNSESLRVAGSAKNAAWAAAIIAIVAAAAAIASALIAYRALSAR